LEFVEKLAIMDVLFESFLQESFIKYKSFPFSAKGFLGHETAMLNVLTYWNHYRGIYFNKLKQIAVLPDELEEI